jgi:alpha,alpha-trehalose phosphorylase
MVKHHFYWVHKLASILADVDEKRWNQLVKGLAISEQELEEMLTYSEIMTMPFNEKQQIVKQDRDFLNKEKWPFTDEEKHPLLLHYHPLTIYRYQVSKQADAIMALMLFPDEQSEEVTRNTGYYYDDMTTHDSSLSYSAFSIVYNRLGDTEKSYQYFLKNARCDLDNLHRNTKDGVHTAAMGGTFMNILYGFCDLRLEENQFTLNPRLPKEIKNIRFSIVYKGEIYRISVTQDSYSVQKEEYMLS